MIDYSQICNIFIVSQRAIFYIIVVGIQFAAIDILCIR